MPISFTSSIWFNINIKSLSNTLFTFFNITKIYTNFTTFYSNITIRNNSERITYSIKKNCTTTSFFICNTISYICKSSSYSTSICKYKVFYITSFNIICSNFLKYTLSSNIITYTITNSKYFNIIFFKRIRLIYSIIITSGIHNRTITVSITIII